MWHQWVLRMVRLATPTSWKETLWRMFYPMWEYDPKDLERKFRHFAESAVSDGKITAKQRKEIVSAYRAGLAGYTYYED